MPIDPAYSGPHEGFHVEVSDDGIAVLTLDRPKANAIDALTSCAIGEMFVRFESFLYPPTILRYDFASGQTTAFREAGLTFDPAPEPLLAALAAAIGWSALTYPAVGQLTYDVASYSESHLYGLHKERVVVDGIPMALYRSSGQGEPILMFHINQQSSAVYLELMSVLAPRYRAIAVGRGANLDLIDAPLTNAPWLQEQFSALKKLTSEDARRQGIARLLNREDPGAGGYYDDLGEPGAQPHRDRIAVLRQIILLASWT